ncbi:hypothetical protein P168DRAFT_324510 [Aspergillus campestris IBT 28561]|uniref:FAS1 domain-containing protein n=1 Tax=Aspergillus campestris (strain IBT 28561) TaxID=1392248 RepID=A0A2I1DB07_ASPC2|nr:uncharacterized protein P168DRAFT_324510 [Aspergillus campestris IBT 28561]PKY07056.1 hypothetical protein P168DRAFT_324510 [Aspergillus campestris IBT 28561]
MLRHMLAISVFIFLAITCTVSAWDLPAFSLRKRLPGFLVDSPHLRHERPLADNSEVRQWLSKQQPLMGGALPKIVMPGPNNNEGANARDPIISDVLPKTRGINIFASLTRDFESIEAHLNNTSKNATVLAPRNSAIQALPRKPWENPDDYNQYGEAQAYEGQAGQDRARKNLERFVGAHIVTTSPWKEGEEAKTLAGEKLSWKKDGDKIYIQPGNVEVDAVAEQVANGEVWTLNGVINYR